MTISRTQAFFGIGLFVPVAAGMFLISTKAWQRLQIDSAWANEIIADSNDVRSLLDQHFAQHGEFPEALEQLGVDYRKPTAFSSSGSSGVWHYQRLRPDDYQLYAIGAAFVSSFDAMVYRKSGRYPAEWFSANDSSHSKSIGDWRYITGFSGLVDGH